VFINNEDVTINTDFVLSFDTYNEAADWKITNDSVMGGLSTGNAIIDNKSFIFSGKISPENSGGFTSTFTQLPILHESVNAVTLVVKGDGKSYQLRVRTFVMGYDLAYKAHIVTSKNLVETYIFYLMDFEASFRGRTINNAPILKAKNISHVGFLLSLTKASLQTATDFSLTVYSIKFHHKHNESL